MMLNKTDIENKQLLVSILEKHKRGYMQTINNKYPFLKNWIYKVTKFLNCMNRKFTTRLWYIVNGFKSYPICKVCGKTITKDIYRLTDSRMDFCSHKCAVNSEEYKKKQKQTNQLKYGCNNVAQVKEIIAKIHNTRLKNGTINKPKKKAKYSKSESKKRNFYSNVLMKNKFVLPLFSIEEYTKETKKSKELHEFLWRCRDCGAIFKSKLVYFKVGQNKKNIAFARCLKCHPYHNTSSFEEKQLASYIEDICPKKYKVIHNKEENYKVIYPYQLDILLIDRKTQKIKYAFEFNGSKWHSVENRCSKNRQLKKTMLCEAKNISLIHIYEDEWLYHITKVKKFIKNILKYKRLFNYNCSSFTVPRDKYPKTFKPNGYKIISEGKIKLHERLGTSKKIKYHVPDCGTITYERI